MATRRQAIGIMLQQGCWFMWPLGAQLPKQVQVYMGDVHHMQPIAEIGLQTALSCIRWHGHKGLYYSYLDYSGKWHDVRVCGDIDAWYGDEWLLIQKHDPSQE